MRELTTKKFITRAKKIHGNKYNYSKVKYINNREKVCIICSIHGEFWQSPDKHTLGQGCCKCGKNYKTTEWFIEKARKTHGDSYNYSKTKYIRKREKVSIICPKHGEFTQRPLHHINGNGCPKCAGVYPPNTEEFIDRLKEIHGCKYNYSKVKYKGSFKEINIICPKHGDFWQLANNHLTGNGCPKCGVIKNTGTFKLHTTEHFIKESIKSHGNKYDYSKVEYNGAHKKVCIVCSKHGEFWQTPSNHTSGSGCPVCSSSKGEWEISKWLLKNKIKVIPQFTLRGCKNINPLPFDFYLPEYNILIEYDGEEHYKPIEFFGGEKNYKKRKNNDKIKTEFCTEFSYNLLRIPYWEKENINEILKQTFI